MGRWRRIAAVTAGLMAAGGIFGTLAGMLVLLVALLPITGTDALVEILWLVLLFSLMGGGGLGVVLGPLAAWVLMRNVPLWLAVGGTTLGTFASGTIGLLFVNRASGAMAAGVAGFIVSAAVLRIRYPQGQKGLVQG